MRGEAAVLTPEGKRSAEAGARSPAPAQPLRPRGGLPVPGARAIDHTADIGLELEAPHLPALFERAAFAAVWMALEAPVAPGGHPPGSLPLGRRSPRPSPALAAGDPLLAGGRRPRAV